MNGLSRLMRDVWALSLPYFRSEDRWPGRLLLGAVIAIELSIVAINVMINQWNARFFNALQDKNWESFFWELQVFCLLAAAYVLLAVYQLYLNQWLQIRWRTWMTGAYVARWLKDSTHYKMQLRGDAADNPDQRIADDINQFVEKTLSIGVRLLGSIVTLFSFLGDPVGAVRGGAAHCCSESPIAIPGYLVWAALIYSVAGTLLAHWIGWPLANLNFRQQRFEADFRFNLVRVRENSEQIGAVARRARGKCAPRGALQSCGGEFQAADLAAETADLLHPGPFANRNHIALHPREPGLFLRHVQLGRSYANSKRLWQRAGITFVLCHYLSHHGGMGRDRGASGRISPLIGRCREPWPRRRPSPRRLATAQYRSGSRICR